MTGCWLRALMLVFLGLSGWLAAVAFGPAVSTASVATTQSGGYSYDSLVASTTSPANSRVGAFRDYDASAHLSRERVRAPVGLLATKGGGGETTRLYRSVDEKELADIRSSGAYRTGRGQEGKPFYPSEEQASRFSRQIFPTTGRPQTGTSIDVPLDRLRTADPFFPAGEGPALFLRQLPLGRPTIHNSSRR